MQDYYKKRDEENIVKIREICEGLPYFVRTFLLNIQNRTSSLTRLGYVRDIETFLYFLTKQAFTHKTVKEITTEDIALLRAADIDIYLDYLSSYTTACGKKVSCNAHAKERKLSALRSLFKYLYKTELIPQNITDKVDSPKIHEKPILYLEPNEVSDMLDNSESGDKLSPRQMAFNKITAVRDTAMLTLFLGTGIRISECVGLNRNSVDFNENSILVTRKGGNQSILYFSEEVATALKDYIDWLNNEIENQTEFAKRITDNDALFLSLKGGRITPRAVEMMVKKYAKTAAPLKKITPHKLRSTFGTSLYNETRDIYLVADVLGHRDINTTKKHYAAMSEKIRRDAADKVVLRDFNDEVETIDKPPTLNPDETDNDD